MPVTPTVALLLLLAAAQGLGPGHTGQTLRCTCIKKEKKPIGRYIESLMVILPSSHCKDIELIATLKKTKEKICLDPRAPWIQRVFPKRYNALTPVGTNQTQSGQSGLKV